MRKRIFGKQMSRDTKARRAVRRSLVRALVINGSLMTTGPKARDLRGEIDGIMRTVRKNDVAARRAILARLGNDREITGELFGKYQALAKSRSSGFVKIRKGSVRRVGDGSQMVSVEWVKEIEKKSVKKPIKKVKKK